MAQKLARLTHKIAIQPHLMAESCTVCSFRSMWSVRKLFDTPSYTCSCRKKNKYCLAQHMAGVCLISYFKG